MLNQDTQGRIWNILDLDDEYEAGSEPEIEVGSTATASSVVFPLIKNHTFAFEVQFESDGAIDVKVELEQAFEQNDDFVVPDNKVEFPMFEQISDSNTHIVAYAPVATYLGRLKLTGQGSNDATTTLVKAKMYTAKNYG